MTVTAYVHIIYAVATTWIVVIISALLAALVVEVRERRHAKTAAAVSDGRPVALLESTYSSSLPLKLRPSSSSRCQL